VGGRKGGYEEDEDFFKLSSPVILLKCLESEKRRSVNAMLPSRLRAQPSGSGPSNDSYAAVDGSSSAYVANRPSADVIADKVPPFIVFQ
jgi:hypothetical protein